MKVRHGVTPLGSIAAGGGSTNEADMGSFSYGWLYVQTPSSGGSVTVSVEAAPEEFGQTPTWHKYGNSALIAQDQNFAIPIPMGVGSDYVIPARLRVTSDKELTGIFIEGVRDLA